MLERDIELVTSSETYRHYAPQISAVTKSKENISYRLPSEVEESIKRGCFLLAFERDNLAGWIEHTVLWKDWSGLFSLYVFPRYRGKRIGSELLEKATFLEKEKIIYAATLNPLVKEKLKSLNYREISLREFPPLFIANLLKKRFLSLTIIYNLPLLFEPFEYFLHSPEKQA